MLVTSLALTSCSKEEEMGCWPPLDVPGDSANVIMIFNATTNGQPLELLKNFKDPLGRTMQVELLKFYVSNVFVSFNGASTLLKKAALVILVDPNVTDTTKKHNEIALKIPYGNYDRITFSVGLDVVQNAGDPTKYPSAHPLSINQNTYWDAWGKYKFFMIEGKGDWDGDGTLTNIYGYHTGFDECYRSISFEKMLTLDATNSNETLNVNFEVNDVFFGKDTLDMKLHPSWHGDINTIETAFIISDNFQEGLRLN